MLKKTNQAIIRLKKENKILQSFVDDWDLFFPDKGPRELRAEFDCLERRLTEVESPVVKKDLPSGNTLASE